jgi:beta-N-acetylhexosaminidase
MATIPEDAGQLLIAGFEGQECGPPLRQLLRKVRPCGVIFFQRNLATPEQFQALVAQVRDSLDPRPFLALDLEGGMVDRFRELLAALPSAQETSRAGLGRELGQMAGKELAAFSLNVDFAPVLDLGASESRGVMGTRTAGETPKQVIYFAQQFLAGLAEQGVLGCGKHFPGLGSSREDSHLAMPTIHKSLAVLWREDLLPFRHLHSILPMIMVAHAWYPEVEGAVVEGSDAADPVPASLSANIVSRLLRQRIGYEGLIVCDDLEMGGALEHCSIGEAAVRAVRAGCEILLVCRHATNVETVWESLVSQAEKDSAFRIQLGHAAERIRQARQQSLREIKKPESRQMEWSQLRREIADLNEEVARRLAVSPAATQGARES